MKVFVTEEGQDASTERSINTYKRAKRASSPELLGVSVKATRQLCGAFGSEHGRCKLPKERSGAVSTRAGRASAHSEDAAWIQSKSDVSKVMMHDTFLNLVS